MFDPNHPHLDHEGVTSTRTLIFAPFEVRAGAPKG